MKKALIKILLTLLALLSGPATIILTIPFFNWHTYSGLGLMLIISYTVTASVWKKSSNETVSAKASVWKKSSNETVSAKAGGLEKNLVIFCCIAWAVLAVVSTVFGLEIPPPSVVFMGLFLYTWFFMVLYYVGAGILSWGLKCATQVILKKRAQSLKQFNSQ